MYRLHSGSLSDNIITAVSYDILNVICTNGPTTISDHVAVSVKVGNDKHKCFSCGNEPHLRYSYPASNITSRNCGKKGHYAKACKSKQNKSVTAATECLSSIVTGYLCLKKAKVPIIINKFTAEALVITGSTTSFIRRVLVEKCYVKWIT